MKEVLSVKNLTKRYKNLVAVDNLTFSLNAGEIVGFIGANGAGKSTTIKLITGLIKPTEGTIKICGTDIEKREKALSNIGAIVETPNFYNYLSAWQNLKYFSSFYDNFNSARIDEVLKLVGLYDRRNDRVGKYSLGMKQRLGIAQALLNNPKILILDEPTNGLDAEGIVQIRNFLKGLSKRTNVTIFVSSHILSELQNLCDRFIIIDKGKIKSQFSRDVIEAETKKQNNTFLSVSDTQKAVQLIKTLGFECKVKNDKIYLHIEKEERGKLVKILTKSGIEVLALGSVKVALENKFLNVIKH